MKINLPMVAATTILLLVLSCEKEEKISSVAPKPVEKKFSITIENTEHGTIKTDPNISNGESLKKGTKLHLTAIPEEGYVLDTIYSAENKYALYNETTDLQTTIEIDKSLLVGASFIPAQSVEGFSVIPNIVYAQPGVKKLKYDIYTPENAKNLPLLTIIHGGGFATNTEDIMRGLAREIVKTKRYVVASIDYRWAKKRDGDNVGNTLEYLVDDVFGALAHLQEHAIEYGADPDTIVITGDSAGGFLSAAAINLTPRIGDGGFGIKDGIYEFLPSYIPDGKTAAEIKESLTKAIKAAAPSYGIFGGDELDTYSEDQSEAARYALSPIFNIPSSEDRSVPQFLLRGSIDGLISDEIVRSYSEELKAAGQIGKYVVVEGANHAFFDWTPNKDTQKVFFQYGVPYAKEIVKFFDSVLNKE